MPLTFSFEVGSPCSGGNHVNVKVRRIENSNIILDFNTTKADLLTSLSAQERERLCTLLLRVLISQKPVNATAAELKAAIEAKIVDLTLL